VRTNSEIGIPKGKVYYVSHMQGKLPSTFSADYNFSHASMS
jgi:hypothetical protein